MQTLLRILALVAVVAVPALLVGCTSGTYTPAREYYVSDGSYFYPSNETGPDAAAADWDLYEDQDQRAIQGWYLDDTHRRVWPVD